MRNLNLVLYNAQPSSQRDSQGRTRYFEQLCGKYSGDLQRYAFWLSGDRHIAEDLVQETLLRAWRSIDKLQNPAAAKSWLLTIVRRENARRFERFQPKESEIPLEALSAKEKGYDTSTEAFVLRQAIKQLPDEYRVPLMLKEVGGYSQKEIAQELNLSAPGVGTRLFRARQKLRDLIEG